MGTERLDTEARREQIVQAALGLIARDGLNQLSMARLARQVGLTPSALYRHYESKDAIIEAILSQMRGMLLTNVNVVCRETADPVERLHKLLFLHVKLVRENEGLPRVLLSQEVYAGHPERRRMLYENISAYLGKVAKIIEEGQRQGRIRGNAQPDVLSVMFLGLIQPAALLWQMSEGEFDVTAHVKKAWKVFRETIAVSSGASEQDGDTAPNPQ